MKRILVSGASGIVGYGILRSLRQAGEPFFLIGTSIYDDSVAPAFCDVFEQAVPTASPEYLDWLLATLRRHRVDLLIPGIEVDMYRWVEHVGEIKATGAFPILNAPGLIAACQDKWAFHQRLQEDPAPYVVDSSIETSFATLAQRFGVPFLLKPRRGSGSKGIVHVTSVEVFEKHRGEVGNVLFAQPIVGKDSEEYTNSAFCDGQGDFFASIAMRRVLSRNGWTEKAEIVDAGEFLPAMRDLCRRFQPLGPTNFQFRLCTDGPKLLEINPRISSSTSIRTAFGYNESAMAVDWFLKKRVPTQPNIRQGRAVRYTDEIVFYEDVERLATARIARNKG